MASMLTNERAGKVQEITQHYAEESAGLQSAHNFFLSELPGLAFAVITLVWIVSSMCGLIW